jgi:hypothetical protein
MAKMTIAQLRERELDNLVKIKTKSPTEADYDEARRNMNSYYRLCGLCERNLYMQNDESMHDTRYAKQCEEKEDRWYKRLNQTFKRTYGIVLVYCGYFPSICYESNRPGCAGATAVNTYFYN